MITIEIDPLSRKNDIIWCKTIFKNMKLTFFASHSILFFLYLVLYWKPQKKTNRQKRQPINFEQDTVLILILWEINDLAFSSNLHKHIVDKLVFNFC